MVDFLMSVIPCQYKTSQELVSHDIQSNVFNYKYTYFVEVLSAELNFILKHSFNVLQIAIVR